MSIDVQLASDPNGRLMTTSSTDLSGTIDAFVAAFNCRRSRNSVLSQEAWWASEPVVNAVHSGLSYPVGAAEVVDQ